MLAEAPESPAPPAKRPRLEERGDEDPDVSKARKDVSLVFDLWKRLHGDAPDTVSPNSLAVHLKDFEHAHVAAQCALAAIMPRMFKKV
jgi:hypothetical protein